MKFTFAYIEHELIEALNSGYRFLTCSQFIEQKNELLFPETIVIRVDIDLSVKKTARLIEIFNRLNIKATFFLRLHAPEYNPYSFENYRILKLLIGSGHELGYHSEVIDQAAIWNEDAEQCLLRDLSVMTAMFGIKVNAVASHGGMTGLNNLDFWKGKTASQFGLLYEAYDKENFDLFDNSFYISDSEWIRWKCYNKGTLCIGDNRSLSEHLKDNHPLIYLLIHPDTYYDNHFYE